jgi:hypothetical protein
MQAAVVRQIPFNTESNGYNDKTLPTPLVTEEFMAMSFGYRRARALLAMLCAAMCISVGGAAAEHPEVQALVFQIGIGAGGPDSTVYHCCLPKNGILTIARRIAATVRPPRGDPSRILSFAVGPIAMDQGADGAKAVIRDAFDVALETDMAVVLHLDDYMFSTEARWPDGRLLRAAKGTTEWNDWSQTPAEGLQVGWMPNARLMPQLCYENPEVTAFETYWSKDVIGQEVKKQVDRLVQAGKPRLFAGIIAGWESNLSDGYCSLSHLGYSAQKPPADFDRERERVLQRHIERWAKGLNDAGIPKELLFTHVGIMPKREYEQMKAMMPPEQLRRMPESTGQRAFWVAFNPYSNPGFTGYADADQGRYEEIYQAVRQYGHGGWAMAEGTDIGERGGPLPVTWEHYLAQSFNHGARLVNIFGAFQGGGAGGGAGAGMSGLPQPFQQVISSANRSTGGEEAIAAYRKFLQGARLAEDSRR